MCLCGLGHLKKCQATHLEAFIGGSWHSFILILSSVAVSGCTVSELTDPQQPVGTWGRLTDMKSSHPAEKPRVWLLEVLQICRLKPSASGKPVFSPTVEGLLEEMTANAGNTNTTCLNVCSFYCEALTDHAVHSCSSEMHIQQISADGCVSDIAKGVRKALHQTPPCPAAVWKSTCKACTAWKQITVARGIIDWLVYYSDGSSFGSSVNIFASVSAVVLPK